MKIKLIAVLLICVMLMTSCGSRGEADIDYSAATGIASDLGGANDGFGLQLDELGVYNGKFTEISQELTVSCLSGTEGAYTITGNTITFNTISEDSVYAISGQFFGNIMIDVGDSYKFELELRGFSLISDSMNPVIINSGSKVSLTAKKDTKNYIYDNRTAIDETDETQFHAAVYSLVDLEICGKGNLTLVSENNKGIHSKDDLQVKNLNLLIACTDNALKGNDSVTIVDATTILIASYGDGIKTTNSNISEKGNQRGIVSISGGMHEIFAACDGIDAAYDVVIDGENTTLSIYTDKYSNYSGEVTRVDENQNYIRFTVDDYSYSVKYYNSDQDYLWVNAEYHSTVSGGRMNYYYYAYPKMDGYDKVQFYIYSDDQEQSQDEEYLVCSDLLTPNDGADTFALSSRGNQLTYEWTNYTTQIQENFGPGGPGRPGDMGGPGGMGEGNTDKGDHSTKGIKAANQILIEAGLISIKSYDDALHANNDGALENGETALGNITIDGGELTLYSNDDGIHADGKLTVNGGTINIVNSYEGAEGANIEINGGTLSIFAKDDGMNTTSTSGNGVTINNGYLYIYCSGDGIDSNSRTAYGGILFNGGNTVVISTSGGNSSIDTEQGYTYNGGSVLAIMSSGGMTNEATHCKDFSSIATKKNISLSEGKYAVISIGSNTVVAAEVPVSINAVVIFLGSNSAKISAETSVSGNPDHNGVCWYSAK